MGLRFYGISGQKRLDSRWLCFCMAYRTLPILVILSTALLVVGTAAFSGGGLVAAQETETANDSGPDTDGDGLSDEEEQQTIGSDPEAADTDGDGLADGEEVNRIGSNPTNVDTDADGITDGEEVEAGTDPMAPDASAAQPAPGNENPLSDVPTGLLVSFAFGTVVGGAAVAFVRR